MRTHLQSYLDARKTSFAELMKLDKNTFEPKLCALEDDDIRRSSDRHSSGRRGSHITNDQVFAFKEAFDLFDKNGGGTIDALELQKTLEDVGIALNECDIEEVMLTLDNDGNGEVDFEEFLKLMTDTEMFIEVLAEKNGDSGAFKSKRGILFDALTEFMKKQALKNAQELVGYYAKKYRKVAKKYAMANKGAHVVQHYADGARLIGLTDAQLFKQLKLLKGTLEIIFSSENVLKFNFLARVNEEMLDKKELQSPYAKSFHMGLLRSMVRMRDRQRKNPVKPFALGGPKPSVRKHLKTLKQVSKACSIDNKKSRITIRIVGLKSQSTGSPRPMTIFR